MSYNLEQLPKNIRQYIKPLANHWIWIGATSNKDNINSKGRYRFNDKLEYAHRVVFHLLTGFDLNSELQVNHKQECQVNLCCHPDCLYAGTQQDNINDRESLGRSRYANHFNCNVCGSELKISPTTKHKYCQVCKNKCRDEWRKRNK